MVELAKQLCSIDSLHPGAGSLRSEGSPLHGGLVDAWKSRALDSPCPDL